MYFKGDNKSALALYDDVIAKKCRASKFAFNLSDATTLLFRLEMEGSLNITLCT